ncbi:MAG: DUF2793 domain-containing protein [Alphaproteobacteria bacterium]
MANTPHLTITLLEQAQAQKEVTVNEALFRIDAVLNSGANDKDLTTPPANPAAGDVYIIPASATGVWAGKTGQVTYFDQVWRFIVPNSGLMLWVTDEAKHYIYNGGAWNVVNTSGGGMNPATYDPGNIAQQVVGTSATQTLTNKTLSSCDANTQASGNNSTKIATTAYVDAAVSAGSGAGSASRVCEGRLTLTSGVPVTLPDVASASTLFFTPYCGSNISLWNGSVWQTLSFSEISMALSGLTANLPYDVFAFINGGTVALERLAWTSNTVRATALAVQNGVLVRSGNATRRYLGTFYATGATTTTDSSAARYLWNYYNRAVRGLYAAITTASYTYSTATWRPADSNTTNGIGRFSLVSGVVEDRAIISASRASLNTTNTYHQHGIAINGTTSAELSGTIGGCALAAIATSPCHSSSTPREGFNFIQALESGGATGVTTWYGGATGGGMTGLWSC